MSSGLLVAAPVGLDAREAPAALECEPVTLHAVPAFVLGAGAGRADTVAALARQSVDIAVQDAGASLHGIDAPYVLFVLAGTLPDVTACERAAWFLATHPERECVTGAVAGDTVHEPLTSAVIFLMVRTMAADAVLADGVIGGDAVCGALALGLRRAAGRGAGWLSEPIIAVTPEAARLAELDALARNAADQLALPVASIVDVASCGVSLLPLQSLLAVTPPPLRHRLQSCTGRRILFMPQGFPMGGYTAVNTDLWPRIAARGHAVTTCSTEIWRTDWRLQQIRVAAPDIHHPHAAVPQGAVPAYVDWLITSRRIEVVLMSHSFLGYHMLPWLRARHPNVAFVDWVRTEWFEPHMYGSYSTLAARWADDIDVQLATSEALVRQLVSEGSRDSTTRPAYIGIDTTVWQHRGPRHAALRAAVGAGPDTVVLLFSGRLSPEKRPALAIDTAAALHAAGVDVVLVVAGNGPLMQATHAHALTAGISGRVKLLGELPEEKLRHIYTAADIFIAPSEIEGVSRSLYEAMAMGCVPVVTDVGGQRELVVEGTGTLVDPARTDATAYVEAIMPWLDPSRRAGAGAAARAHIVKRFDTARTVDTVLSAVEQAIAVRPGRAPTVTPRMAEQLAVMSLEITRRHVSRALGR